MRAMHRLTAAQVKAARPKTMIADGGGLYLLTGPSGSKSWVFRFARFGQHHEMGLGSLNAFNLTEARDRARTQRQLLADGADPLALKRQAAQERVVEAMRRRTFQDVAAEFVETKRAGWKSEKHLHQWNHSLGAYVYPKIGTMPVGAIGKDEVLKCIRPIWQKIPETANRVRNRVEMILDFAVANGYRPEGPNPAVWDANLEHLLPSRAALTKTGKVARSKHYEALPYKDLPEFMAKLRRRRGATMKSQLSALAIEWLILTAARSGEVRGITDTEVDPERRLWTIPAGRMKGSREHVVPLTERLINDVWPDALFGGVRDDRKIFRVSEATLYRLARQIAGLPITLHGFRSTFRDWCAENGVSRDLAEMSLAHTVKNQTEAAYNRTSMIEQRREVIERWATFVYGSCDTRDTIEGVPIS
jgi:integrase